LKNIVKELQKTIPFKTTTNIGDILLVAVENPKSVFYAVVNDIERDNNKKDEWWHVTMTVLSVPPQKLTWTLRTEQFTGQEIFTMGNEGRFIQAVDFSKNAGKDDPPPKEPAHKKRPGLRLVK